jgi:ribosome-binding protein aMBF1 (putative translation factor)
MNCEWCVNPHPGKPVTMVNGQRLCLCRDCQALARGEGSLK